MKTSQELSDGHFRLDQRRREWGPCDFGSPASPEVNISNNWRKPRGPWGPQPAPGDDKIREVLYRSADEAMMLRRVFPPRHDVTPKSYFGGVPRLPAGTPWPVSKATGLPMSFFAQIDLESLPAIQLRHLLPEKGSLAFFGVLSWSPPENEPSGAVIYVAPEDGPAIERPEPSDLIPLYDGEQSYYFKWLDSAPAPADLLRSFPRWEVEPVVMRSYADEHPFDEGVIGGRYQQLWEEAQRAAVIEAFGPPVRRYWPSNYTPGSRDIPPGYPLNLHHYGKIWFPDDQWPYAGIFVEIFAQLLRSALRSGGLGLEPDGEFSGTPVADEAVEKSRQEWLNEARARRLQGVPAELAAATLARYRQVDQQTKQWLARGRAQRFSRLSETDRQEFRSWCAAIGVTELYVQPEVKTHQNELFIPKFTNYTADAFFYGIDQCLMRPDAIGLVPPHLFEVVRSRHSPVITNSLVGFTRHQLLGSPRTIEHAATQFRDTHRLLGQLDSDTGFNWMWADMGALQYWITHDDLAARRFDRVIMTAEGSRFLRPRRQHDAGKRKDQRHDLRQPERLAQRDRGRDDADDRHRHGADRRHRGRQAGERGEPADIGDAELDHGRIDQQPPAEFCHLLDMRGLDRRDR